MNRKSGTRGAGVTATPAAILDFSQGKTGHEQSHFGQQICHCRLAERPFHFRFLARFKFSGHNISSIFTSVKLKSDGFKQQNGDKVLL